MQGGGEHMLQHHEPFMLALPPARKGPNWTQINTAASLSSSCSCSGVGEAILGHLMPVHL